MAAKIRMSMFTEKRRSLTILGNASSGSEATRLAYDQVEKGSSWTPINPTYAQKFF